MRELYSEYATYSDPIFNLKGKEVPSLWYMMCTLDNDLSVTYKILEESGELVHTEWTISYILEVTGKRVKLNEKGFFRIIDGKIVEHRDEYDLWSWSSQGLGFIGKYLGWSGWFQNRVRKQAKRTVDVFIQLNPDYKPEL